MEMIARLLAEREQRGLRQLFVAALGIAGVLLLLNIFFLPDTPVRNWRLMGYVVPVGGSLSALWLLRHEHLSLIAGLLFAVLAASYFGMSAFLNYLSLDPQMFARSGVPLLADKAAPCLIVAATALTLRPIYPVVVALSMVAMYVALLLFGISDPRTEFAADYAEYLTRPAILPTVEASIIAFPLLVGLFVALAVRNARDMTRRAVRLEVQNRDLSRYFSPNVVARITSGSRTATSLGGNRQNVVILFSDLEGFTALSASMQPEEALAMLSDYQGRMVEAIFANRGTLDKFIGDGIMATFGTPDPDPDAAGHAVQAALAMQDALERLNREREAEDLVPLRHRIGIHAGPALVGNAGTPKRLEFTVIGASVNEASRVERACKELGESLLVSQSAQAQVSDGTAWRTVGKISVEGRKEGLMLFAPESPTA